VFYYYGGKRSLARFYDAPAFPVIVEPFAGSAAYSLFHLASVELVLLVEKDPRVAEVWRRLLSMTPKDVLAMPIPEVGEQTSDFLFMTVATSNGVAVSKRMTVTPRMPREIRRQMEQIARVLPMVKAKVRLIEGDYRDAPNIEATWFIDPPYQPTRVGGASNPQGMGYARGCSAAELDFEDRLGEWVVTRRGQVIVCEQEGADWLPFRPLARRTDSIGKRRAEVVWTNDDFGQMFLEVGPNGPNVVHGGGA
jgi:site-specific DNA-adenine methylase